MSVTSGWRGGDGRKCGAAGEVGAPVQVSGSPSSLTNFEIDLQPPFPRCDGAQAEERSGLLHRLDFCFKLSARTKLLSD